MKNFKVEAINIKNLRNGLKVSRHQLGYKLKHKQEDGVPKEEIAKFLQINRTKHNLADFNIRRLEQLIIQYKKSPDTVLYNDIKKLFQTIKIAITKH